MFPRDREPKKKWNKCMHDLWTSGGNCFESFLRRRQKYKVKWQIIILAEISRFAGDFYVLLHHHTPFAGIVFHELVKAILARISIPGFTSSRNDRKACAWTQQQLRWSRIFMELACALQSREMLIIAPLSRLAVFTLECFPKNSFRTELTTEARKLVEPLKLFHTFLPFQM